MNNKKFLFPVLLFLSHNLLLAEEIGKKSLVPMKQVILTTLRNKTTSTNQFRKATDWLSKWLAWKAGNYLPKKEILIETPLAPIKGYTIEDKKIVLIGVIRSGMALIPSFLDCYPNARVGYLGLERDEHTALTTTYYCKIPKINDDDSIIICEPMIATAGSVCKTIEKAIEQGAQEKNIIVCGVIAATQGLEKIKTIFPRVKIIAPAIDTQLNECFFIVPGLGDFGDRFFDTEVGVSGLVR